MRVPTHWTPSCGSSTPSTQSCVSTAWTPNWSSRWSSRCSTSWGPSHWTTSSYGRTCAPGVKACRSGERTPTAAMAFSCCPTAWRGSCEASVPDVHCPTPAPRQASSRGRPGTELFPLVWLDPPLIRDCSWPCLATHCLLGTLLHVKITRFCFLVF